MNIKNDFLAKDFSRINNLLKDTDDVSLDHRARPFSARNFSYAKECGKKINRMHHFPVYSFVGYDGKDEFMICDTVNLKMYDIDDPNSKDIALDIARSLNRRFKAGSKQVQKDSARNIRKRNLSKSNG